MGTTGIQDDHHFRIKLLDAYRGLAILLVVMYHFTSRYEETRIDHWLYSPFHYGFFGVQLFFILSGIVIVQSLVQSRSIPVFAMKRVIRLLPSLLFCSIFTYFAVPLLDRHQVFTSFYSTSLLDFLPSLFISPPDFWNALLDVTHIRWISPSYWSLFPEVLFYTMCSIVFFKSKLKNFVMNWLLLVLLMNSVRVISSPHLGLPLEAVYGWYLKLHFSYWIYFSFGVFMYGWYSHQPPGRREMVMMGALLLLEYYFLPQWDYRWIFMLILVLVGAGSKWPDWMNHMTGDVLMFLGKISYPLYLIHELVGTELIYYFNLLSHQQLVLLTPWLVFALMVLMAAAFFQLEKLTMKTLRKSWLGITTP